MSRTDVAKAFGEAAPAYAAHAEVQARIAAALAARVRAIASPGLILEIGCGDGALKAALSGYAPNAAWMLTDLAPQMVAAARARDPQAFYAVMDGEAPALRDRCVDLLVSSLALQWFTDLAKALNSLAALLRPGGRLAIATLAAGSFDEWRAACAVAGAPCGVPDYPNADALRAACAGLHVESLDIETFTAPCADARDFLRGLKRIGAGRPRPGYRPQSSAALRAAMRAYPSPARAVYQTAFLIARKP